MTARCPACSRPLYPTNRGGLVCVPCELATTRAKRNGTGKATATNERHAAVNRERSRKYMARKRAAAKGRA